MLRSGALSGSLASIMETTIFSKSSEVMCRSRPRLRLLAHESCLRMRGRMMSTGADSDVKSTASSSGTESTLPDNWGRSSADESRFCWISCGWLVAADSISASPLSQQNVSRFQSRQLRFSSRLPCATESRHLAKTFFPVSGPRYKWVAGGIEKTNSPVHMLKRFSGFVVSTLWMTLASTCKTGASKEQGMLV